ncbi:hypothetical protein ANCCAN_00410 [Ancylostoma caninum]|uniref:Uncharacterized protein n=1 Tax=Ancylostoma caninum TaxID=29170 RepID=A0A368HDD5_ANCCA|nr:hypothetical protein ANCCAN_00410 [Ancylostoma caninum]
MYAVKMWLLFWTQHECRKQSVCRQWWRLALDPCRESVPSWVGQKRAESHWAISGSPSGDKQAAQVAGGERRARQKEL